MSTDAPLSSPSPANADASHLPDDPVVLKQMIAELLATLHTRDRELDQAHQRLDQLLRRLYGPRAERLNPDQLLLFAQGPDTTPATESTAAAAEEQPKKKRKVTPHGRRKLPRDFERRRRVHDLSDADKPCPCCGQVRTIIGEETSEQLDYEPASLFIIEHVRLKYACKHCQEQVTIAAKPAQPIDKGLPGPGLLAQVIVSKYADHLPLYRLERIFSRQGITLQRSTLCGWMAAAAELLTPICQRMKAEVLGSKVIHTDDTPVPVLDETRNRTRQGSLWVYLGDAAHPYIVYDFTPTHVRTGPEAFLADFHGFLQADAFSGYDAIYTGSNGRIREVACWAHARRKFYEARTTDPDRAHAALGFIRGLYEVERLAKDMGLSASERAAFRQLRARPILAAFRGWLDQQLSGPSAALPKSPMGQAIAYTLSNWDALHRYTDDGDLAIDNNVAENALRAIAIGRKNWMFCGSDKGGRTAATLFSFTATCRRHQLDPFAYLRDVLERLPTQPADHLDDLLPDRWGQARRAAEAAATAPDNDTG